MLYVYIYLPKNISRVASGCIGDTRHVYSQEKIFVLTWKKENVIEDTNQFCLDYGPTPVSFV